MQINRFTFRVQLVLRRRNRIFSFSSITNTSYTPNYFEITFIRYDLRKVESRGSIDSVSRARSTTNRVVYSRTAFYTPFSFFSLLSLSPLPTLTARLVENDRGVTRSGMKRTGRSFLIRRSAK